MFPLWIQGMELEYKDGYLERRTSRQHKGELSKGSLGPKGPWEAESSQKQEVGHSTLLAPHQDSPEKSSSRSHGCIECVSTSTLEFSASVFLLQTSAAHLEQQPHPRPPPTWALFLGKS